MGLSVFCAAAPDRHLPESSLPANPPGADLRRRKRAKRQ
jgi:hypothetical protein